MASTYIDQSTGEIISEPEFVKVYIRDLCRVKGLNATQYKIFNFMLLNMNYENVVAYGSRTKNSFLTANDLKPQTFNNNINFLISAGLIERISRGEFRVNKKFAVKVDWTKVQSIEWRSIYSEAGVSEEVKINEK
nr:replication/maintenance protein RepL [Providencia stuartii]